MKKNYQKKIIVMKVSFLKKKKIVNAMKIMKRKLKKVRKGARKKVRKKLNMTNMMINILKSLKMKLMKIKTLNISMI